MVIKNVNDLEFLVETYTKNNKIISLSKKEGFYLVDIDYIVFKYIPTIDQMKTLTDIVSEEDICNIILPGRKIEVCLNENRIPYYEIKNKKHFSSYEEIDF